MSKIIALTTFNNYFNRTVKYYASVSDYESAAGDYLEFGSVNFTPNDGVKTSIILNLPDSWDGLDYILVANDANQIVSRWFVLDSVRTRGGQCSVSMRRDVVADNLQSIKTSPCFVERGPIDSNSPLLFNSEGLNLNQIKTEETLIKDATNSSWLVAYLEKNATHSDKITADYTAEDTITFAQAGIKLKDSSNPLRGAELLTLSGPLKFSLNMYVKPSGLASNFIQKQAMLRIFDDGDAISTVGIQSWNTTGIRARVASSWTTPNNDQDMLNAWFGAFSGTGQQPARRTLYSTLFDVASEFEETLSMRRELQPESKLNYLNGNYVFAHEISGVRKYYKARVTANESYSNYIGLKSSDYTAIAYYQLEQFYSRLKQLNPDRFSDELTEPGYWFDWDVSVATIELVETTAPSSEINITLSGPTARNRLEDAPYDMICMRFDGDLGRLSLMQKIVETLTKKNVKDAQILPYCPARFAFDEDGEELATLVEHKDYD